MDTSYSALELARAAGYFVRPVESGGLTVHEELHTMDVGPLADDLEILRVAYRHLRAPVAARPADWCVVSQVKRLRTA